MNAPTTTRAERFARYKRPLPPGSVAPPLAKQLSALSETVPNECVRLDNAVDQGRMHPAAAQSIKHALRHALATFERLAQGQAAAPTDPQS